MHAPRILILEDRSWVREILCGHVRRRWRSADVGELTSADAQREAARLAADRNLAIVAMSMDRTDGLALLKTLAAAIPDLPLIALLDGPEDELAAAALRAGASDVLLRGQLDAESVQGVVREALRSRGSQRGEPRRERPIAAGVTRIADFDLHAVIASGPSSSVFRARCPRYEDDLAVKVLPGLAEQGGAAFERFMDECKQVSSIDDAHVVRVHETLRAGGDVLVAMEYLPGGTLRDALLSRPIEHVEAVNLVTGIFHGLASLHDAGLCHRDIKPANVMLRASGRACLIDVGRAAPATASESSSGLFGTPYYMSPEQSDGGKTSPRSDLYSAGVVLYELLSGRKPFVAATTRVLSLRHRYSPRPRLAGEFTRFQRAVESLMAVDPQRRPAGARAAADLVNLCASS